MAKPGGLDADEHLAVRGRADRALLDRQGLVEVVNYGGLGHLRLLDLDVSPSYG
ncbi:MAG TPA: hypothetical protein VMB05_04360 [Solirubrobacteraceae bacterium]|nr:hypothetical protein [Solirubrobacteraceae bacterium]